ncbi:MAG: UbiA family prenyltransferase [Candidatus Wallbacteria bacterium]|nr:UbiA family prenyltransferase [Candidatus Wallbacteria bacterium]
MNEPTVASREQQPAGLFRLWVFMRPFTLAPPAVGMLSGAVTAWGAKPPVAPDVHLIGYALAGAFVGSLLNGASNALNQIYDLEIDRVNKPGRLLPSRRISEGEAWSTVAVGYLISMAVAVQIGREFFVLAAAAATMTVLYSAPPFRTKRFTFLANLTIAIPRGVLLKVAGWSTVRSALTAEPWYIGLVFGSFLLGAASTKDFSDMKGDGLHGCRTLPVRFGPERAAWMVAPFFVWPFLLIPLGVHRGILTGNPLLLDILGWGLAIWGLHVARLMVRNPAELAQTENHPSWTHMYLMMMTCQVGFAVAYCF